MAQQGTTSGVSRADADELAKPVDVSTARTRIERQFEPEAISGLLGDRQRFRMPNASIPSRDTGIVTCRQRVSGM